MTHYVFTILGCGASLGVPRVGNDWGDCDPNEPRNRRTRCSFLIERFERPTGQPTRVLVDTGPDLRQQLLAAEVDRIDAVVYTHPHADHLHGIDELRVFAQNSGGLIDIFADDFTEERLMTAFRYCFEAEPGSFYPPILKAHRVEAGVPIAVDGPGGRLVLTPFLQLHGDIQSLGYRVIDLAYSCDISGLPEESHAMLSDLRVWIVDALRRTPHPSHFSLDDAIGWSRRFHVPRTILTHMHGQLDYRTLVEELPEGVEPAYDGMTIFMQPPDPD